MKGLFEMTLVSPFAIGSHTHSGLYLQFHRLFL